MQWFEFAIGIPPAMGEGAKFSDFGLIDVHIGLLKQESIGEDYEYSGNKKARYKRAFLQVKRIT